MEALLAAGQAAGIVVLADGRSAFNPATGRLGADSEQPGHARVADFRRANGVVAAMPALRWSISATASAASSCTRSRTPLAAMCCR